MSSREVSAEKEREETDWRPTASRARLELRARLLSDARRFFAERGVLEVETPLLGRFAVTDPHLESFAVLDGNTPCGFLQTSPEYAMKRLLAAGAGSIYQIARAFRRGERGRSHNPEFTLIEWYRVGWDHHRLMDEVEALVRTLLEATDANRASKRDSRRVTYGELFEETLGVDPHRAADDVLRRLTEDLSGPTDLDRDGLLAFLLTHAVEPRLERRGLVFVHGFPASQAALARVERGALDRPLAARFELYVDGVELANGFHELRDAAEQRRRFAADLAQRKALGNETLPLPDGRLLGALEAGLPECSGVALGLDRLLMVASGASDISEVLAFPIERA